MITRFSEIGMTGKISYKCSCGKRVVRQKRFCQTLNPWNKNADGSVKDQRQILDECRRDFDAWRLGRKMCFHVPPAASSGEAGEAGK